MILKPLISIITSVLLGIMPTQHIPTQTQLYPILGNIEGVITEAAEYYHISPELMLKIAKIESNLNPNAKSKTSSARGLFQIIKRTERSLRKKCKYIPNGGIFDIRVNSYLAACLINMKQKAYLKKFKNHANFTEIYIMFFFGQRKSFKLFHLDQNKIAAHHFPKLAKSNYNIFYLNKIPRTVQELYDFFKSKIEAI